mgnify:CR=1 FL=1|jgi:hypothetical protein
MKTMSNKLNKFKWLFCEDNLVHENDKDYQHLLSEQAIRRAGGECEWCGRRADWTYPYMDNSAIEYWICADCVENAVSS